MAIAAQKLIKRWMKEPGFKEGYDALAGARAVGRACVFLGENSRRAHPARDRRRGRLSAGLFPLVTR